MNIKLEKLKCPVFFSYSIIITHVHVEVNEDLTSILVPSDMRSGITWGENISFVSEVQSNFQLRTTHAYLTESLYIFFYNLMITFRNAQESNFMAENIFIIEMTGESNFGSL